LAICRLRCRSVEEIKKPSYLTVFDGPDMGNRSEDRLAGGLNLGGITPDDDYVITLNDSFADFSFGDQCVFI
jgi:hypothetical protein